MKRIYLIHDLTQIFIRVTLTCTPKKNGQSRNTSSMLYDRDENTQSTKY